MQSPCVMFMEIVSVLFVRFSRVRVTEADLKLCFTVSLI